MSLWETQARLLTERLDGFLHCDLAEITDDDVARLVCAASVLVRQHRVDKRGRCRHCYSRTRWWWVTRRTPCTVHSAFSAAMNQPLDTVWQWMREWGKLTRT